MKCKFCGVDMEEESLICPACGKDNAQVEEPVEVLVEEPVEEPVEEAVEQPAEVKDVEAAAQPEKTEKPKEKKAKKKISLKAGKKGNQIWKVAAAIILCLALVGGLVATIVTSLGISITPTANDLLVKHKYIANDTTAKIAANRVVATMGDAKLTNVELQVYFWSQYYDFLDYYGSYLDYLGLDENKPLHAQKIPDSEFTWEQYFVDTALNTWMRYQVLVAMAEENEAYTIPEELKTYLGTIPASVETTAISSGYESVQAFLDAEMGIGCKAENFVDYLTMYHTSLEYYDYLYKQSNPTQEELETAYTENAEALKANYGIDKDSGKLIDVRHILIEPEGGEEDAVGLMIYTDEAWEACRKEAQRILDEWKAGEATEESFGKLAEQYTEDPGSKTNGGLYANVSQGRMVEAFDNWCFDDKRQSGDVELVKTEFGYHVMYFVDGAEAWERYAADLLAYQYCNDLMFAYLEEHPMDVNFRGIALGKSDFAA